MIKQLAIVVFVVGAVACKKGDKCEQVYDKVAPLLKGKSDKKEPGDNRAKMVEQCKAELKDHPEREKWLDCILGVSGDLTLDKMMDCEKVAPKDKDGVEEKPVDAMVKMTEFKDQMCKCADAACAKKVSDDMTAWSEDMVKNGKPAPKMSEEDTKKATEIGEKMGECMQKAMGAGSAK